jgi:hypothetical protein
MPRKSYAQKISRYRRVPPLPDTFLPERLPHRACFSGGRGVEMAQHASEWARAVDFAVDFAADVDEHREPRLARPDAAAIRPVERLEEQLSTIVAGDYTVHRLSDLARERFDEARDELTRADLRQLEAWLDEQCGATRGAAQIKWRLVRDALGETRDARGGM